jgi:hypothetical protein
MIVSGICAFVLNVAVGSVHGLFMENAWFNQFQGYGHNKKATNNGE